MEESNPYATPEANVDEASDPGANPYGGGELASRGSRLAAKLVSGAAFFVPAVILVPVMEMGQAGAGIGGILLLLVFLGVLGLNIYWLADNAQTVGKRALGIKIVRSDRFTQPSLVRLLFIRGLSESVASSLCSLLWLVDVLFIFSEDRQCLHDLIADTTVIVDGTEGSQSYATDPSQIRSSAPSHQTGSGGQSWDEVNADLEPSEDEPSLYNRDGSGPGSAEPPEEATSAGGPEDDWSPPSGSDAESPSGEEADEQALDVGGGTSDDGLDVGGATDTPETNEGAGDDSFDISGETDDAFDIGGGADDNASDTGESTGDETLDISEETDDAFDIGGPAEASEEQSAEDSFDEDLSSAVDDFEEETGSDGSSDEDDTDSGSDDAFDDADYKW